MRLPKSWAVPQIFRDRMGDVAGAQRAMVADGHLLLILHRLPKPGERRRDRDGLYFWRDPAGSWQFSGHGVGNWQFSGHGAGPAMLRKHIQDHEAEVLRLERDYEEAKTAAQLFEVLEAIGPLHRSIAGLHATLQMARQAVHDRELIILRDWAGEIDRIADLLQRDARNALDFAIAHRSEEQARIGQERARAGNRLNTLAAIFLPLTAIGSVLGMNLPNGLEHHSPLLFWFVFAGGLVLGLLVQMLVTASFHRGQE